MCLYNVLVIQPSSDTNPTNRVASTCGDPAYFTLNFKNYELQNSLKKQQFYLSAIQECAPHLNSIYEIGVGKGVFLSYASEANYQVSGCDINPSGIAATKQLLPHARIEWSGFEESDMRGFEIVVSFDVMEHIPNVHEIFELVYQRLKQTGRFVFLCPVYDGPLGGLVRTLDKDPTHLFKESRYWWLELARSKGFRILGWKGVLRYLLPTKHYLHLEMKGLLKHMAPAVLIMCAKDS